VISRISQLRFEALVSYTRHPIAAALGEEVAWYRDDDENLLGVVVRDRTDGDYMANVLGRDESRRFRAIETLGAYETRSAAKRAALEAIEGHVRSATSVFPQGGERQGVDLFDPVVPISRLNPNFRAITEQRGYSPALEIMKEMANHFVDPDGNFVQQFQTEGFDARIWEMYLFAVLNENGLVLDRSHHAPDFVATRGTDVVCLEAVIAAATMGGPAPPTRPEDIEPYLAEYMPIKFGSPLFSKLGKKYWNLPHVAGRPLVFAIHDFHDLGSMTWTGSALPRYLYGMRQSWRRDPEGNLVISSDPIASHKHGSKEIPSGYFLQPDSEHVSAVFFGNSGTIAKFNRMGHLAGFGSRRLVIRRKGTYHDHDPRAAEPRQFEALVGSPGYSETWSEGASVYHNPHALVPLDPSILPGVAHHFLRGGQLVSDLPDFHPYGSLTTVLTDDQ
jgi:hypothetical protein